jgi:hypothetical protein
MMGLCGFFFRVPLVWLTGRLFATVFTVKQVGQRAGQATANIDWQRATEEGSVRQELELRAGRRAVLHHAGRLRGSRGLRRLLSRASGPHLAGRSQSRRPTMMESAARRGPCARMDGRTSSPGRRSHGWSPRSWRFPPERDRSCRRPGGLRGDGRTPAAGAGDGTRCAVASETVSRRTPGTRRLRRTRLCGARRDGGRERGGGR